VVFSLAADGEAGVRKVLKMLHDELEITMALCGCRSLKDITDHVVTEWDHPRISPRLWDYASVGAWGEVTHQETDIIIYEFLTI